MNKKLLGQILFLLSIIIISLSGFKTITGNSINVFGVFLETNFSFIIIIFFIISLFLMVSKTKLDAILVLGSVQTKKSQRRADKGAEAFKEYHPSVIIASGGNTPRLNPKYKHEAEIIYRELRKKGIKPKNIHIESSSQNTLENILNSFKKINGKKVGIVSSPSQLKRINYIINKAKEEGYIEKDVEIENIETEEGLGDKIYESLGGIFDKYNLRKGIDEALPDKRGFKRIINYFVKKFS